LLKWIDTKELTELLVAEAVATSLGVESKHVNATVSAADAPGDGRLRRLTDKGMAINAKVSAPGGWSQKKLDSTVESRVLSEDSQLEMEEMLSEVDGLQEASSGEMEFEQIKGEREEPESSTSTSLPLSDSSTPSPSSTEGSTTGSSTILVGKETSSATTLTFLLASLLTVVNVCGEFPFPMFASGTVMF